MSPLEPTLVPGLNLHCCASHVAPSDMCPPFWSLYPFPPFMLSSLTSQALDPDPEGRLALLGPSILSGTGAAGRKHLEKMDQPATNGECQRFFLLFSFPKGYGHCYGLPCEACKRNHRSRRRHRCQACMAECI